MTIIHECDRCNAPGRVIETSDGFRCEGCYEEAQEQVRSDASCPKCGRLGVTATGICYACENTAPVRRGITALEGRRCRSKSNWRLSQSRTQRLLDGYRHRMRLSAPA